MAKSFILNIIFVCFFYLLFVLIFHLAYCNTLSYACLLFGSMQMQRR